MGSAYKVVVLGEVRRAVCITRLRRATMGIFWDSLCLLHHPHTPAIALCQLLVSDPVVIVFLGCRWQELLDYPLRARNFCYGIRPHHWCANALTYWGSFSHPR